MGAVATATRKTARKAKGDGHLRRAEILEAAERIFVAEGYEGATIRKIADEVGVSSTALYMHFPDKAAILSTPGVIGVAPAAMGKGLLRASGGGSGFVTIKGIDVNAEPTVTGIDNGMRAGSLAALANRSPEQLDGIVPVSYTHLTLPTNREV